MKMYLHETFETLLLHTVFFSDVCLNFSGKTRKFVTCIINSSSRANFVHCILCQDETKFALRKRVQFAGQITQFQIFTR